MTDNSTPGSREPVIALTEEKIDELRKLLAGACSSPQLWQRDGATAKIAAYNEPDCGYWNAAYAGDRTTADLIVSACQALPDLLEAASASLSHKARADRLEERVRELDAALKPFAEIAAVFDAADGWSDSDEIVGESDGEGATGYRLYVLRVEQFRAAARTLTESTNVPEAIHDH